MSRLSVKLKNNEYIKIPFNIGLLKTLHYTYMPVRLEKHHLHDEDGKTWLPPYVRAEMHEEE